MPGRRTLRRAQIALAAVALLGGTGCGYNRIQQLDEQANTAQHNIETQLQRRADLIPNLVATVKGYAQQEQIIFTRVADAQRGLTGALAGHDPSQMAQANDNLTRALVPMLTLVQAYPQLQSNQQFLKLQDELTGTENRIAVARTDYNSAVREYNTTIRTFPSAMTAKVTGAKPRAYFEVTNPAAREAPTVDFSQPAAPGAATPATPAPPPPAPSGAKTP
ncbi:LemA family protein [Gemmatirosa kalamazoonensis]|uniref:LemA family protein n=1 Tax=Gemmatirosa kalamazoonensis TaxID=861299 RepID=W0RIE6_9BACT|nr:LemA family protein [Gemmatirosa kalamazoonensis]AHG90182.1 LemA family protein [Gemmatirosa kalamazoonensis]